MLHWPHQSAEVATRGIWWCSWDWGLCSAGCSRTKTATNQKPVPTLWSPEAETHGMRHRKQLHDHYQCPRRPVPFRPCLLCSTWISKLTSEITAAPGMLARLSAQQFACVDCSRPAPASLPFARGPTRLQPSQHPNKLPSSPRCMLNAALCAR